MVHATFCKHQINGTLPIAGIFSSNDTVKWRRLCVCLSLCLWVDRSRENNEFNIYTEENIYYYILELSLNVAHTHSSAISASDFEGLKFFCLKLKIRGRIILFTLQVFKIFTSFLRGSGGFFIIKWNIILFFSSISLQSPGNLRCFNISHSRKETSFILNVFYIHMLWK